jgi:biopolymer transport protein ExbB
VGEFFARGGIVMYPILAASILALGVFFERMVYFLKTRESAAEVLSRMLGKLKKGEISSAREDLEKGDSGPFSRFLAAGLAEGVSLENRRQALEDAGKRESFLYRRYLRALSAVAQISPLLGLLGTVTGMIAAFRTLEETTAGMVNPAELSRGIWEALITTAFGLCVAIPAYVAYHVAASMAERRTVEMEVAGDRLIETMTQKEAVEG